MADSQSPQLYLSMILAEIEPIKIVERAIDSVFDQVDGVYITITYNKRSPGKSSKLYKFLKKKYQANISFFKWVDDFSMARNFAMDKLPRGGSSYFIWQDADDIWIDAHLIREIFDKMIETGIKSVFLPYWYQVELDENGDIRQILTEQKRERIVINDGTFKWVAPLHETLINQKLENSSQILLKEPVVVHLSDNDRFNAGIKRNIRILEKTRVADGGKDPRITMYLAKSYFDMAKAIHGVKGKRKEYEKHIALALEFFHTYLDGKGEIGSKDYISSSGWAEERSVAWSLIGEIAILVGDFKSAEDAYKSAIDESEKFPNYYVNLAFVYIKLNKWDKAKHYLTIGTNMEQPNSTITTTPRDFELQALEATIQLALHDRKFQIAKKAAERMVVLIPENKEAKERVITINSLIIFNKACQSAVFLGKYLEQIDEQEKIPYLIKSFSKDMQKEKFTAEMRRTFLPPRTWAQNEISIVAGPGFEEWTPDSIKTGLGGSETAIVHMSDELTKLGWMVTVYGNPGARAGKFNGVDYKMWYEFNPHDNFNVLILWRGIGFADIKPKAKFTVLWTHDCPNNSDFTKERLENIDRIIVLSEFHKNLFRMNDNGEFKKIPDEKFWVSSNGIVDMSEFTQ